MKDIPHRDRPISERYRVAAKLYAGLEAAASFLEEMKTPRLEKLKSELIAANGNMPENRAERLVKSSQDWHDYIRSMCDARAAATDAKEELAALRMEFQEWQAADANSRAEYKLGRMGT